MVVEELPEFTGAEIGILVISDDKVEGRVARGFDRSENIRRHDKSDWCI
jgi:hypothetical protein